MRRTWVLVLSVLLCAGIGYANRYVVDSAIGDVFVKNKGKTREVRVGYTLIEGDTIITGKSSECYISVEKKGYIKVEENSSITFEQINRTFGNKTSDSLRITGNILFSISGVFTKNKVLNAKTETAFATVRGTEFVIESKKEATVVYVLTGKVAVAPLFSENENELSERTITLNEGEKIEISEIDIINATSFLKEGEKDKYNIFLTGKKKPLITSEKERFNKRMKLLRELQKKRMKELEKKKKEYLKDPSKMFEEE